MMYTSIYWHVINIYLFKFLYTCLYLVYTIISLVYVYLALYLVYLALYLVYMRIYQVYDRSFSHALSYGGAFYPCPVIWQNQPYVHCHISVIYIYRKTLVHLICYPYAPHDGIIEYMELTSQDFMLSGFLWHVSNTDMHLVQLVIWHVFQRIWQDILGVCQYLTLFMVILGVYTVHTEGPSSVETSCKRSNQ